MIKNIAKLLSQHKIITVIIIIILASGGYWVYQKTQSNSQEMRYVIAMVEKGTITLSVSGSGQVSVSNQVDIKSKASGDIIYVGAQNGQKVGAGALLVQLDARDAQKTVRDAEANLENARITLAKLKKPADALSILQAENALAQAQESKQDADNDLKKAYEDGFNTVANAFLDLPTIMAGLDDLLYDETLERSQQNVSWYANQVTRDYNTFVRATAYKDSVENAYRAARLQYNANFDLYKTASRSSNAATLESLILETYDTVKIIADTVKTTNNYIDFIQDFFEQRDINIPALVATHQSTLDTYTSKTNAHLTSLLSAKRTIDDAKQSIINADRSIAEKTESLAKLRAGADALDIRSAELTIQQRQNTLTDAREKLADYFIRAPFAGVVAHIDIKKGDTISANAMIATLITEQRIAEISLNEVDVARVKIDQKATLTFDAVPDSNLTGKVAEIDTIGTASQGIVSYIIKITFDTQDERVKPGMSVNAAIITDTKLNVLTVPNSAVKSQGDMRYVEIPNEQEVQTPLSRASSGITLLQAPRHQTVEVGISNAEFTEIISGLKEGDIVITNTLSRVNGNGANRSQQQSPAFRIPGLPSDGSSRGGAVMAH